MQRRLTTAYAPGDRVTRGAGRPPAVPGGIANRATEHALADADGARRLVDRIGSAAGNQAVQRLARAGAQTLQRSNGGAAAGKGRGAAGKALGSVLVLGRFDRPIAGLQERGALATGRAPILLGELQSAATMFESFFPSGLASGSVVQEALEGGAPLDIRAIYIETADVDLFRGGPLYTKDPNFHKLNLGGQTAAEYRNVVAAVAARNHRVDVYIRHHGGVSVVKAGSHTVTGAPLPDELRAHWPASMFPGKPPPAGAGGGAAPPETKAPREGAGAAKGKWLRRGAFLATVLADVYFAREEQQRVEAMYERVDREIDARLPAHRFIIDQLIQENPHKPVYVNVALRLHWTGFPAGPVGIEEARLRDVDVLGISISREWIEHRSKKAGTQSASFEDGPEWVMSSLTYHAGDEAKADVLESARGGQSLEKIVEYSHWASDEDLERYIQTYLAATKNDPAAQAQYRAALAYVRRRRESPPAAKKRWWDIADDSEKPSAEDWLRHIRER